MLPVDTKATVRCGEQHSEAAETHKLIITMTDPSDSDEGQVGVCREGVCQLCTHTTEEEEEALTRVFMKAALVRTGPAGSDPTQTRPDVVRGVPVVGVATARPPGSPRRWVRL